MISDEERRENSRVSVQVQYEGKRNLNLDTIGGRAL